MTEGQNKEDTELRGAHRKSVKQKRPDSQKTEWKPREQVVVKGNKGKDREGDPKKQGGGRRRVRGGIRREWADGVMKDSIKRQVVRATRETKIQGQTDYRQMEEYGDGEI